MFIEIWFKEVWVVKGFCNLFVFSCPFTVIKIVYKKTEEWYIEWQRVTTNDNEWYNEWQRMTKSVTSGATSDKELRRVIQRVTTISNEWQRATAVVQSMKTAQYTSKNGWLPSFQWQKQMYYYFKGWMAAVRVVK